MLLFLDVELCRDSDGTITTSAYRKTTHTNLYPSFALHHLVTHKVAVVWTLMFRANTLPSLGVQRVEERIVDALKEDGHPSSFIRKHLCPPRHRQEVDVRRPRTTVTLPYINGLSEPVRRTDWPNPQTSTGRASTGPEEWRCSCISPRIEHFGHRPPTGPHQSH